MSAEQFPQSSKAPLDEISKAIPGLRLLSPSSWRILLLTIFVPSVLIASWQMVSSAPPPKQWSFWKPLAFNQGAYLPAINRNLYSVAEQPYNSTLWIGGEDGYLAYRKDSAWQCLTYDPIGVFYNPHTCDTLSPDDPANAAIAMNTALSAGQASNQSLPKPKTVTLKRPTQIESQNAVSSTEASPAATTPYQSPAATQQPLPFIDKAAMAFQQSTAAPVQLSRNELTFGDVPLHQPSKLSLELTLPQGAAPVGIGTPQMFRRSNVFTVVDHPCTQLLPNERTCTMDVVFTPEVPGDANDLLSFSVSIQDPNASGSFTSNAKPIPYNVIVSGTGTVPASSPIPSAQQRPIAPPAKPAAKPAETVKPQTTTKPAPSRTPAISVGDIVDLYWESSAEGDLLMSNGGNIVVLRTINGGQTWTTHLNSLKTPLIPIAADSILATLAGRNQLCPSIPFGKSFATQVTETAHKLVSLVAPDRPQPYCHHFLSADDTKAGGSRVEDVPHLNAATFNAIANSGWAVGGYHGHGAITQFHTEVTSTSPFSSITLTPITAAADLFRFYPWAFELPAPWFAVVLLACIFCLLGAHYSQHPPPPEGITGAGVSDRPLKPDDSDAMRLSIVADGISRFFRNENTNAPLVLCINGGWGTGKSSLMNLLADNLGNSFRDKHRVIPFNAWHHQSEDQMLASLLQAVRQKALLPPWTPKGFWLRLRIFCKRWPDRWFVSIVFLVSTGWSIELLKAFHDQGSNFDLTKVLTTLPVLLTAFATLRQIVRGFTGFLSNPAALLTVDSGGTDSGRLEAQTTLRARFAIDFKSVTEVLGNGHLVLIIDDLDRCQPEKIREVVEAINFLVTAGDCYVVLGMARDLVEHYLGHSFEDSVKTMPSPLLGLTDAEAQSQSLRESAFARLYLEKLIQIQFNLRALGDDQAIELFENSSNSPSDTAPKYAAETSRLLHTEHNLRYFFRWLDRWFLPMVGTVLLLFAGSNFLRTAPTVQQVLTKYFHTSIKLTPPVILLVQPALTPTTSANPQLATDPARQTAGQTNIASKPPTTPPSATLATIPSSIASANTANDLAIKSIDLPAHNADESKFSSAPPEINPTAASKFQVVGLWALAVLACWFAGIWLLSIREAEDAKDSQTFLGALRIWAPFLLSVRKTPRGLKQFLNHVRFLAMLQRAEAPPKELDVETTQTSGKAATGKPSRKTPLRWLALLWVARRNDTLRKGIENTLARSTTAIFGSQLTIPDEYLVTLTAIDSVPELWALVEDDTDLDSTSTLTASQATAFQKAMTNCIAQYSANDRVAFIKKLATFREAFCALQGVPSTDPEPVHSAPPPPGSDHQ